MLLLLIIADDFTGALDTGVQFAAYGAATRVMVKDQVDFASCDAQVLVVDTAGKGISDRRRADTCCLPGWHPLHL